jgi:hypothetical protein
MQMKKNQAFGQTTTYSLWFEINGEGWVTIEQFKNKNHSIFKTFMALCCNFSQFFIVELPVLQRPLIFFFAESFLTWTIAMTIRTKSSLCQIPMSTKASQKRLFCFRLQINYFDYNCVLRKLYLKRDRWEVSSG